MRTAIWFATWSCPLKCPYCWQRNGTPPAIVAAEQQSESAQAEYPWPTWFRLLRSLRLDQLDISGGEPLMLRGMGTLLRELWTASHTKTAITTNAVCREALAEVAGMNSNVNLISWTLSIHPSCGNEDAVWRAAELLRKRDYHVTINHVLYPGQVLLARPFISECARHGYHYHADPYCPPIGAEAPVYTDEEALLIRQLVQSDRQAISGHGMCDAGSRHFVITPSARVYPCVRAMLNGWSYVDAATYRFDIPAKLFDNAGTYCDDFSQCAGCDRDQTVRGPIV